MRGIVGSAISQVNPLAAIIVATGTTQHCTINQLYKPQQLPHNAWGILYTDERCAVMAEAALVNMASVDPGSASTVKGEGILNRYCCFVWTSQSQLLAGTSSNSLTQGRRNPVRQVGRPPDQCSRHLNQHLRLTERCSYCSETASAGATGQSLYATMVAVMFAVIANLGWSEFWSQFNNGFSKNSRPDNQQFLC